MEAISRITSRQNDRLAGIRKVRDGTDPEWIFIEGLRMARETLRSELHIVECVMTPAMLQSGDGSLIAGELSAKNKQIIEVPDRLFRSLADTVNSQGIILIADRPKTGRQVVSGAIDNNANGMVLFLQQTNDPSNLGAVYRTAEAAGAAAVIVSSNSANVFSPKAIRASMGSNLRLPTWEGAELTECVTWAKGRGMVVRAADISASASHYEIEWKKPSMVVFGSEAHGLSDKDLALADEIFKIRMRNEVESLNLAVSAGIVLFEAQRQSDLM